MGVSEILTNSLLSGDLLRIFAYIRLEQTLQLFLQLHCEKKALQAIFNRHDIHGIVNNLFVKKYWITCRICYN